MNSFQSYLSESTNRLFVYQTLRNNKTLEKVLGHTKITKRITLYGWNEKNMGNGYHTIVKGSSDSVVNGDVMNVSDKDLEKLDEWEERYRRITVKLDDGRNAFVYIMRKK